MEVSAKSTKKRGFMARGFTVRLFRKQTASGAASSSPAEQTLIVLGCDNAGKTTLIARLNNNAKPIDESPTVGFSNGTGKLAGIPLTLFDVGGGKNIRGIWDSYYADVHAAIFVVDSADSSRFPEMRAQLSRAPVARLAR